MNSRRLDETQLQELEAEVAELRAQNAALCAVVDVFEELAAANHLEAELTKSGPLNSAAQRREGQAVQNTTTGETALEQSRRHVAGTRGSPGHQAATVGRLRALGHDATTALTLLETMQVTLEQMREHLPDEEKMVRK